MTPLREILLEVIEPVPPRDPVQFPESIPAFSVAKDEFQIAARVLKKGGARLAAEWAVDETGDPSHPAFVIYACYHRGSEYLLTVLRVPANRPAFPSLTREFPTAWRFERQMQSLMGVIPTGHPDPRPWIKHEDWPEETFPLRKSFDPAVRLPRVPGEYPWIRGEGEGVYEIPVGPVHAGIIEPGHFRFQSVGEDVLNLEAKLGYVHKGIEKRFESLSWSEGGRLAGRVSGDSTVAHALAWCRAVEAMTGCRPPERAHWLRALFLERERIANHLGDLGALANDAALSFMLYQFSALRERLLRTNRRLFGHRFLMDRIVPGGVTADLTTEGVNEILWEMDHLIKTYQGLVTIYDENASLDARLRGTGILSPESARELGVVGPAARASGQELDIRLSNPFPPYDRIRPQIVILNTGDVHARGWVRIEEIRESVRLVRELVSRIPEGEIAGALNPPTSRRAGFAAVEGWRGEILYWVQSGTQGEIARCMVRDPSSVNWLGLELAIRGNIVPEFPLCNKSFNQSYSGNDL